MGVAEHVRRDILGHTPKSMTGDYTHASPEEMERAMELVAPLTRGGVLPASAKSRQNEKRRQIRNLPSPRKQLWLKGKLVAGGRLELPTLGL